MKLTGMRTASIDCGFTHCRTDKQSIPEVYAERKVTGRIVSFPGQADQFPIMCEAVTLGTYSLLSAALQAMNLPFPTGLQSPGLG